MPKTALGAFIKKSGRGGIMCSIMDLAPMMRRRWFADPAMVLTLGANVAQSLSVVYAEFDSRTNPLSARYIADRDLRLAFPSGGNRRGTANGRRRHGLYAGKGQYKMNATGKLATRRR
jgi:hypothetical protein